MSVIMLERLSNVKNFFRLPFNRLNRYTPVPKPKSPEKPMTIAAGFTCNNGLILATDLEVTESMIKRVGGKSTYFKPCKEALVGIAGAGFYPLLAYACEVMEERVTGGNFKEIVSQVRKTVSEIYKQHIRPSYPSDQWSGALQLIIGVAFSEAAGLEYAIYASEMTVLTKVEPYAFVGAGKELAYYLMKNKSLPDYPGALSVRQDLRRNGLEEIMHGASINQLVPLVRNVILEVEENIAYCGKGVKILRLPFFGDPSYDKGPEYTGGYNESYTAPMDAPTLTGLKVSMKVLKKSVEAYKAAGGESATAGDLKVHINGDLVREIQEKISPEVLESLKRLQMRLR